MPHTGIHEGICDGKCEELAELMNEKDIQPMNGL